MLLRAGSLSPSLRPCPLFGFLTKTPSFFIHCPPFPPLPPLHFHHSLCPTLSFVSRKLPMNRFSQFCTFSAVTGKSSSPNAPLSNKEKKKVRRESPQGVLLHKLGVCSKDRNLVEALQLYDDAKVNNVRLALEHYNMLLYLCSLGLEGFVELGLERGFEIYKRMRVDNIVPNEATFTSVARLAAAKEDPEMAFDLVKQMKSYGLLPKLRSYGPALYGFCSRKMADKAYEVDAHMVESGVLAEENEIRALLKVSVDLGKEDKVYEMLHRLRVTARQVAEESAVVVEEWFGSTSAAEVGEENWDVRKIKEGVVKGGGGWHGQGWLGKGKWKVVRTEMDESGVCRSCREKLVCIDIDPRETAKFSISLTKLACEREAKEAKASFLQFQEWLQRHGPFDAVVDGANIGLSNQQSFNFLQLNNVVNQLRDISPSKKLPLVILHRSRVIGGPALHPRNKKLLENWKKSGALYATPHGSNDDWYWLYAAVSCRSLLVTNDEMRDHLFQLLGTSFFPRWKEKHQVRIAVSRQGLKLHMPPPYSIVIQEAEQGSWHVPTVTGDDLEIPRQWLCATRTVEPINISKAENTSKATKPLSQLF
ncbi:proteinaceous RNase P 1, chloroplastic/mitochondrial [Daucus carota subsp. sativus]|nr:PREDICTED: proteinaceous RNase P 1, chloroplastic/mitochondrial [Daucus carota subsp. sativus]